LTEAEVTGGRDGGGDDGCGDAEMCDGEPALHAQPAVEIGGGRRIHGRAFRRIAVVRA
jgi:hypothetical protein